jgi:hypothetical protein
MISAGRFGRGGMDDQKTRFKSWVYFTVMTGSVHFDLAFCCLMILDHHLTINKQKEDSDLHLDHFSIIIDTFQH